MLSLTDTIWRELEGGYRVPYDASKALARMEGGESAWDELWNELHHQGDVGVASYAAIPQIVRIYEARRGSDWNLYALAATIEIERHRKTNPLLPPIDNNHIENRIRPVALGRSNWLFAGSLRAGQRAATIMSLIQSAKLNGHDPYRYLKDILERLPTQPASRVKELMPHCWQAH
jgi:transposase